jgi:predicted dehydrogenase
MVIKKRIGLIGTGFIGCQRAQFFTENPNCQLVLCSNRTHKKAEILAGKYNASAVERWEDVASSSEVDIVSIATPNKFHFDQIKFSLEHGKHVLVEYPMCQSLEHISKLRSLAESKGVILHQGLNHQHEPFFRTIRDNLENLGDIGYARMAYFDVGLWYSTPSMIGNRFLALHIHFIDYYRGWFGEPKSLVAVVHDGGTGEEYPLGGTVLMEFEKCPSAIIEWGMGYTAHREDSLRILGTRGVIEKRDSLKVILDDKTSEITMEHDRSLKMDTDNFVSEIIEGSSPLRSWEDQLRTIKTCIDCKTSAETGKKILY